MLINKLNKYFSKPTELFARFVEGLYIDEQKTRELAPNATVRFFELLNWWAMCAKPCGMRVWRGYRQAFNKVIHRNSESLFPLQGVKPCAVTLRAANKTQRSGSG